jgi:hypothetical protein
MKITLDISRLVEEGKLTAEEADRLKGLASSDIGTLAFNILIGFGVVAVAAGAVALVPAPATAVAMGIALFAGGIVVVRHPAWLVLGEICLIVGALMFSAGVIALGEGSLGSMLLVTGALALAAVAARSSLLMCFAVLGASACLGARTGYAHATYSLAIFEPTLTIVLFAALAFVAFQISKRVGAVYERLALAAARTSILLVNCGFWIGSLWGDPFFLFHGQRVPPRSSANIEIVIPAYAFSIVWALALIAALVWAMRAGRAWLVNTVAVFGAIHFYTQWFEKLGATPLSVLVAGVALLLAALALRRFNRKPTVAGALPS